MNESYDVAEAWKLYGDLVIYLYPLGYLSLLSDEPDPRHIYRIFRFYAHRLKSRSLIS